MSLRNPGAKGWATACTSTTINPIRSQDREGGLMPVATTQQYARMLDAAADGGYALGGRQCQIVGDPERGAPRIQACQCGRNRPDLRRRRQYMSGATVKDGLLGARAFARYATSSPRRAQCWWLCIPITARRPRRRSAAPNAGGIPAARRTRRTPVSFPHVRRLDAAARREPADRRRSARRDAARSRSSSRSNAAWSAVRRTGSWAPRTDRRAVHHAL